MFAALPAENPDTHNEIKTPAQTTLAHPIELDSKIEPEHSRLITHLNSLLTGQMRNTTSKRFHLLNLISFGSVIIIGSVSGIPYFTPAKNFAEGSPIGYLYGSSIVISLGTLATWSLLDLIHYQQQTANYREKDGLCIKISYTASSLLAGILTAIPGAYIGFKYNSDSPAYSVMAGLYDFITNSASFNRAFRKMGHSCQQTGKGPHRLNKLINLLVSRFHSALEVFLNLPEGEQQRILNNYNILLFAGEDSKLLIKDFLYELLHLNDALLLKRLQKNSCINYSQQGMIVLGLALPLAWSYTSFIIMYHLSERFIGSTGAGFIAAFTIMPTSLLEAALNRIILAYGCDSLTSLITATFQKDLAYLTHKKKYLAATGLGLFITFFCYASRGNIINTELDGAIHDVVLPWAMISSILFKSSAMFSMIKDLFHYLMRSFGDYHTIRLSKFANHMSNFLLSLSESSNADKVKFVDSLDVAGLLTEFPDDQPLKNAIDDYTEVATISSENKSDTSYSTTIGAGTPFWQSSQPAEKESNEPKPRRSYCPSCCIM